MESKDKKAGPKRVPAFDAYIELQTCWQEFTLAVKGRTSAGIHDPAALLALAKLQTQVGALIRALNPTQGNKVTAKDIDALDKILGAQAAPEPKIRKKKRK